LILSPVEHNVVRILVVDPCPDTRKTVGLLFETLGCEVRLASNTASAFEAMVFDPHIILMEVLLPGEDGWAVGRLLRAQARPPCLLVAHTVCAYEDDRARSSAAGFDRHLTKPSALDDLRSLLAGGR
jgi:CheY-like chemotaxis protein